MLFPAERRRARSFAERVDRERPRPSPADGSDTAADRAPEDREPTGLRSPGAVTDGEATDHEVDTMLALVARLEEAGAEIVPDPEFQARLRTRLVAIAAVRGPDPVDDLVDDPVDGLVAARAGGGARLSGALGAIAGRGSRVRRQIPRRIAIVASALTGLVALSGVGVASGGANPGDALYGVKRSREAAQLALARSPVVRGQLHLSFARNRLAEASAVAGDAVELDRVLDDMDTDTRAGMRDLGSAAVRQSHPAPLDLIDEFALLQYRELAKLPAHDTGTGRVRESLTLIGQISTRSAELRGTILCAGTLVGTGGNDQFGPRPRVCSALPPREPDRENRAADSPDRPRSLEPRHRERDASDEKKSTGPTASRGTVSGSAGPGSGSASPSTSPNATVSGSPDQEPPERGSVFRDDDRPKLPFASLAGSTTGPVPQRQLPPPGLPTTPDTPDTPETPIAPAAPTGETGTVLESAAEPTDESVTSPSESPSESPPADDE